MKYFFAFATLLFLLLYCKKPPVEEPATAQPDTKDTVAAVVFRDSLSMRFNGQVWKPRFAEGDIYYPKNIAPRFAISARRKRSVSLDELFGVGDIPFVIGSHKLEWTKTLQQISNGIPQALLSYSVDQDQGVAAYRIDTTRNDHYIEVMAFDTVKWKTVEGRFRIFLKRHYLAPGSINFPDTIACTEGYFKVKLK